MRILHIKKRLLYDEYNEVLNFMFQILIATEIWKVDIRTTY
jgi:hypothetical protein